MAIRFMDGFDKYHSTNNINVATHLARTYNSVVSDDFIKVQAGRYGGQALEFSSWKELARIEKSISSVGVTYFVIGFNYKYVKMHIGDDKSAIIIKPSNATEYGAGTFKGITFRDGGVVVYNSGTNGNITSSALTNNTWYHIEVVCPITAGVNNPAILYINGVEIGRSTHSDASIGWNGTLQIKDCTYFKSNTGIAPSQLIDDFYVLDNTGSTNNGRLSSASYIPRIETLLPNSTVANDFGMSDMVSEPYQAMDNVPVNTSHYAYSSVNGNKTRSGLSNLTNISSVKAVQFNGLCANSTAATDNWKFLANNTEVGTTKTVTNTITSSTAINAEIFEVNPVTSSNWTSTSVNSIEVGVIDK